MVIPHKNPNNLLLTKKKKEGKEERRKGNLLCCFWKMAWVHVFETFHFLK